LKKVLFCISALTLTAISSSLFAEENKRFSSDLRDSVEIHSKAGIDIESDAGPAPITPSRSASLKGGQYLDIAYPGTGWIYLGEMEGSSLLKYEKREIGDGDTIFTLQARNAGTALLHFYKSDALAGSYIDDYLSVSISGTSRNAEHVEAPAYADIVPPRPSFTKSTVVALAQQEKAAQAASAGSFSRETSYLDDGEAKTFPSAVGSSESGDDKSATVIQTSGSPTSTGLTAKSENTPKAAASAGQSKDASSNGKADTASLSEGEVLELARSAFESKDYQLSLSYLDDFFDKAASLMDEGLYLKGNVLEAPSSLRNIKEALANYRTIVSNYPESDLWDDASKRISYIQRIYFDIR
jgi:hypothetical protein